MYLLSILLETSGLLLPVLVGKLFTEHLLSFFIPYRQIRICLFSLWSPTVPPPSFILAIFISPHAFCPSHYTSKPSVFFGSYLTAAFHQFTTAPLHLSSTSVSTLNDFHSLPHRYLSIFRSSSGHLMTFILFPHRYLSTFRSPSTQIPNTLLFYLNLPFYQLSLHLFTYLSHPF